MSIHSIGSLHDLALRVKRNNDPSYTAALAATQEAGFNNLGVSKRRGATEMRKIFIYPDANLPILPNINSNNCNLAEAKIIKNSNDPELFDNVVRIFTRVKTLVISLLDWLRHNDDLSHIFSKDTTDDMNKITTSDEYTLGFKETDDANEYLVSKIIPHRSCNLSLKLHIQVPSSDPNNGVITLSNHHTYQSRDKPSSLSSISLHEANSNPSLSLSYERNNKAPETITVQRPAALSEAA